MVDLLLPVLCAAIAIGEAWIRWTHGHTARGASQPEASTPSVLLAD